ncbi:hypothetical protein SFC88_11950 [Nocardioides sp. HM23]|uniref:hypothetical protein n=1 Tax=Nocardioides bizhenqiangii TaxID=3095076 RepID=UPI002ACA7A87|nr:hypothetical protein [Nocardioides sp. HM23]MDZ5621549.1 hypothetical protein [Nocardioides sp. HM23]
MSRLTRGAALAAVLLVCACDADSDKEQGTVRDTTQNQQIVDAIAADIDGTDGAFTKVDGVYRDDASTAQQVSFTIRCDSCDAGAVIDQVVEAVWASEVDPLRVISVSVTGPDGYQADTVVLADRAAELTERYGERPSG